MSGVDGETGPGKRHQRARRASWVAAFVAVLVIALFAGGPAPFAQATGAKAAAVPRIIIDTDLSLYWDDATAIGMANVLEQRGKVRILGIVSDVRNPVAVAAIDAIDTAYGHRSIPVGAVADSKADTARHGYTDVLVRRLPHAIRNSSQAQGAVPLYRRLLAGQPAHSVIIVSLGGYTNLAGLLRSKPGQGSSLTGRALIAAKVKRTVIEDGLFPNGGPGFTNTNIDPAAMKVVVGGAGWPTPMAWVDGFIGIKTDVGGTLCTTTPRTNPMRIVYQALFGCGPPKDGDWDGPTLLYAVGGRQGLFSELGQGGSAVVNAQGGLSWKAQSRRLHDVYVHVANQQALNLRMDRLLSSR